MPVALRRFTLPLAAFICAVAGLAAAAYVALPSPSAVRTSSIGGPFKLVGTDGHAVSDASLVGQPTLIFFGYTHCPDVCPTTLADITEVFKTMGPKAKVQALFITIDPARDTPAAMKEYVANFDPRIQGLTGDEAATEAVEKAFRVYAKKVPTQNNDYTMDHTAIIYLMDSKGRFVNAFNLDRSPADAAKELNAYL